MTFDKYDEIVVHTCDRNAARMPPFLAELDRIGMKGVIAQKYGNSLHANVRETLRRAVEKGYGRVLCLEDDVRFLKNADVVRSLFLSAPEKDFDICSFDNFLHLRGDVVASIRFQQVAWIDYNNIKRFGTGNAVYGASCWSFGAKAARVLLESYDTHPDEPPDSLLFTNHQDLKTCFLSHPVCMQVAYKGSTNVEKGWAIAHHSGYAFLNYGAYNVPEGYTFGSVIEP